VEEKSFVGAYERVNVRIDLSDSGACETNETPFYLTTETPKSHSSKPIIATQPFHSQFKLRKFAGWEGGKAKRVPAQAAQSLSSVMLHTTVGLTSTSPLNLLGLELSIQG